MFSQLVSANPKGANPKGANTTGMNHIEVSPLLIPQGQVRIYLGTAHRFIWPVHLAGWLELGWTTEPRATPGVTPPATAGANGPGATPVATPTPSKTRRSNKEKNPTEPNPTNESPLGVGSAKAVEPLPVLVTDFLVDPSVPTND